MDVIFFDKKNSLLSRKSGFQLTSKSMEIKLLEI